MKKKITMFILGFGLLAFLVGCGGGGGGRFINSDSLYGKINADSPIILAAKRTPRGGGGGGR